MKELEELEFKVICLVQGKQESQQRKVDRLQQQLLQVQKEKAALEAHTNVLEKALMKVSMERAEVQASTIPSEGRSHYYFEANDLWPLKRGATL